MKQEKEMFYFITGNNHKFNEIKKLFQNEDLDYELKQKTIPTIEIQASSIKEVALFKLKSIKNEIDGSYFVEDAGFFIDIPLKGFPGVYSKFVLNTLGNKGILNLINDYENTVAHFEAVIALYFQPLNEILVFEGTVEGKVSEKIRGTGGFGFDPIFIPKKIPTSTFAELTTEEKNALSHRGKVWKEMVGFLKKNRE